MKFYKKNNLHRILNGYYGGIPFRILLVFSTLIVIGIVVFFMLEYQKKINKIDHRKAIELSDYGIQKVMEQASDPAQIKGIIKTEYNGGWYKVDVSTSRSDSTLLISIESEGSSGTQSVVQEKNICFYRSIIDGDSVWVPK